MSTTYKGTFTVPVATDLADGPTAFAQFADSLDFQVFANVTDRDAWASPPNGAIAVTADTYSMWMRRGSVWSLLTPVKQFQTLAAPVISTTAVTLGTVTVPAVNYPRVQRISLMAFISGGPASRYQINVSAAGGNAFFVTLLGNSVTGTLSTLEIDLPANTSGNVVTTVQRVSGAENGAIAGDGRYNRLDVVSRGV